MLSNLRTLLPIVLLFIANFLPISSNQSQNPVWHVVSPDQYPADIQQRSGEIAHSFVLYRVEIDRLRRQAAQARAKKTSLRINFPWRGDLLAFSMRYNPVLSPALAEKYPGIMTFSGSSLDGQVNARISITPLGVQAVFASSRGSSILHPADRQNDTYHYNYVREDAIVPPEAKQCSYREEEGVKDTWNELNSPRSMRGEPVELRTYRLVIGSPAEFTGFTGGTITSAMSSITNVVNSMNFYMNRDAGIEFELIEETEDLIFVDEENDPYPSSGITGDFLGANPSIVAEYVDPSKYDVAHVFSTFCSGGAAGISGGSTVCAPPHRKGLGVSCTYGSTFGFIMTTTHEFGHHLSASHTFSNCPGSGGQLAGTAYEPGSGSTIMSYAGACGNQNFAPRDDYFHGASIEQMRMYVTDNQGGSCGTVEDFGNTKPTVVIPEEEGLSIPILTPFELSANASDMEGDPITYCWEQFDLGPVSNIGNPIGNAPAFRSFPPSSSPKRIFPELTDILNDINDPTEVLVDYSRDFNFRCTVRDNNEDNGAQNWDQIHFRTTDKAGPFQVLDFSEDSLHAGDYVRVRWDVANTDKNPVNCQSVDIELSTDGGQHFGITLLEGAPNTGSAYITVPNVPTEDGLLKVKASDNIFFNISENRFRIHPAEKPGYLLDLNRAESSVCLPSTVQIPLPTESLQGFENDITFEITDTLPTDVVASFNPTVVSPGDTAVLTIAFDNRPANTEFDLDFRTTAPGGDTLTRTISFSLLSNDFSTLANEEPVSGTNSVGPAPEFRWTGSPAAGEYILQIAERPDFEPLVYEKTGIRDTSFRYPDLLPNGTLFYWRIIPVNSCGGGTPGEISAFQTKLVDCQVFESEDVPKVIPTGQGVTVTSVIELASGGSVEDVNLPIVSGNHTYIGDLQARLVSPQGSEVKLWTNKCFNYTNFHIGFNDDSPKDLGCPLTTGEVVQPQGNLSSLEGENAAGQWKLKITDTEAGSGGRLENWSLELCSSASANPPYLVRNDTFALPRGATRNIRSEFHLLVKDDDNSPEEIRYVLVEAPQHGSLNRYDEAMEVGDYFTQRELYDWYVSYTHDSSEVISDAFRFIAEDPNRGWTGIHTFKIVVDNNVVVNTSNPGRSAPLSVYPNPVTDRLTVELPESSGEGRLEVIDLNGRMLHQAAITNGESKRSIDVSPWMPGMYFIRFNSDRGMYQSRFIVN